MKVRSEELEVRSGGAAHKLRSAANLESQRVYMLSYGSVNRLSW